jgi:hypothetical protein
LFVNGRRLALRGRAVTELTEDEAVALRAGGINLLVVPVAAETESFWELADTFGLLVLGRVDDADADTFDRVKALAAHACCLGWLVEPSHADRLPDCGLVGVSLDGRPAMPLPGEVQFILGDASLADVGLPLIVVGSTAADAPSILGCANGTFRA